MALTASPEAEWLASQHANHARRVDSTLRCAGRPELIDCAAGLDCGAAVTGAKDMNGTLWQLPSTCIPSGWRELPPEQEIEVSNLEPCRDLPEAGARAGDTGA